MVHRLDHDVVRQHVELLLRFALNVFVVGGADDIDESGHSDLVRNHLGGEREVVQYARKLAAGFRVEALLFDNEALDRYDGDGGVVDHVHAPGGRL